MAADAANACLTALAAGSGESTAGSEDGFDADAAGTPASGGCDAIAATGNTAVEAAASLAAAGTTGSTPPRASGVAAARGRTVDRAPMLAGSR